MPHQTWFRIMSNFLYMSLQLCNGNAPTKHYCVIVQRNINFGNFSHIKLISISNKMIKKQYTIVLKKYLPTTLYQCFRKKCNLEEIIPTKAVPHVSNFFIRCHNLLLLNKIPHSVSQKKMKAKCRAIVPNIFWDY